MPHLYNKSKRTISYYTETGVDKAKPGDVFEVTKEEQARLLKLLSKELVKAHADAKEPESTEKSLHTLKKDELVELAKGYGLETEGLNKEQLKEAIQKEVDSEEEE